MGYKKLFNLTLLTVALITLASCGKRGEVCDATYFGGHIKNPKQAFVTLSKNDVIVDTMYLDEYNNFMTQLDVDAQGLYHFNHGLEYQYVYFEPRDSILLRLNTWDFDESLVFSGRGSEKNNFLIGLYLQNEKNEHSFSPYYNLESEQFEEKINSSLAMNNFLYDQLKESGVPISEKFDALVQVAITFPLFRQKEIYPMVFKNRKQLENFPTLTSEYYAFRETIDLNNEDHIFFAPYHNLAYIHLYAKAHQQRVKDSNFTADVLTLIANEITVETFKNMLLRQVIYNDFRDSKTSCTVNKEALKIFNANCTDKKFLKQINNLADDFESVARDTNIDNFEIVDINSKISKINKVIKNKKSVVYFWSPIIISPEMLIKRVKYLEGKYPEILFVGINMEPSELSTKVNKTLGNQFFLTDGSSAHNYIKSLEPRTILINNDGVVANSFTYLSSPHLERQLTLLDEK